MEDEDEDGISPYIDIPHHQITTCRLVHGSNNILSMAVPRLACKES